MFGRSVGRSVGTPGEGGGGGRWMWGRKGRAKRDVGEGRGGKEARREVGTERWYLGERLGG